MPPPRIDSLEALEAVFGAPSFLLLKHSNRCGVSARAFGAFEEFLRQGGETPGAFIDVVEDRELSAETARRTGVEHASPQAILLRDGVAVWNASHFSITIDALAEAIHA